MKSMKIGIQQILMIPQYDNQKTYIGINIFSINAIKETDNTFQSI